MTKRRMRQRRAAWIFVAAALGATLYAQNPSHAASPAQSDSILDYFKQTWSVLTRSNRDLANAAVDPKFTPLPDGRWPVYVARGDDLQKIEKGLRQEMPAADFQEDRNSSSFRKTCRQFDEQRAALSPRPYVVPGGRFNEMYGWDSYFIQVGLLRDGEIKLAKDMADNFLYEIRELRKDSEREPHLLFDAVRSRRF